MAPVVVVLAFVLGACTNGSSGPGDATGDVTHVVVDGGTGFAGEFESASERYTETAQALQQELQQIPSGDEPRLLAVVDELRLTAEAAHADLAAMTIPSQVAQEMTTVLQLLEEQADALGDLASAVRDRDSERFRSATDSLVTIAQRSGDAQRRMRSAIEACGAACA